MKPTPRARIPEGRLDKARFFQALRKTGGCRLGKVQRCGELANQQTIVAKAVKSASLRSRKPEIGKARIAGR